MKELQDGLAGRGVLERSDLEMAVRIAKEVGKRYSRNENLHDFKAPDRVGNMRLLSELTAGDPGSQETDLKIMHPGIPLDTAKQLGLATFRDRYLELLNDPYYETEFAQKGSPKTIIDDVLRRYSIDSTFGEYLVNAEDCGSASTIVWIIDDSDDYPTTGLLSPGLADFQGPALFCYNDGSTLLPWLEMKESNLVLTYIKRSPRKILQVLLISVLDLSRMIPPRLGNSGEGL